MSEVATTPILHSGERPGRGEGFAYDEARHLAAYLYARELARDRQVLDAGCGTGRGLGLLRSRYPRADLLGVDFAQAAISAASRRACSNTGSISTASRVRESASR